VAAAGAGTRGNCLTRRAAADGKLAAHTIAAQVITLACSASLVATR
jgi:hypothetical protein